METIALGNLISLDLSKLGAPEKSKPSAELLIEGEPEFSVWRMTEDGSVSTGVWQATRGAWHSNRNGSWEFCIVTEGEIEVQEEGGEAKRFRRGDSLVMKPEFRGIWRVIEPAKKIWVIRK